MANLSRFGQAVSVKERMSVLKARRKIPKMSTADVERVLQELDAWCRRERPGRLTWERLEEFAGFTRQARSANELIAQRYGEAKHGNSPARKAVTATPKSLDQRVIDSQRKVDNKLQAVINRYDVRFSNIAVNATLLGYDLERLEEDVMPPGASGGARREAPAFNARLGTSERLLLRVGR